MSATVVEVDIAADEFALSRSLAELEGLHCEIERVVAHEADCVMPFVWMSSDTTRKSVEATLANDPSVADIELLADLDDEWLFRMKWVSQIDTLVQILLEEEGTILAAMGNNREWNLRIIFPDRDALSRTYDYCKEKGVTLEILQVYELDESRQGRFGLTDDQQTTLTLAFEQGYYDIPRQATAEDLGDEIDVSHQAISERLRRGHGSLVENALVLGQGGDASAKRGPK